MGWGIAAGLGAAALPGIIGAIQGRQKTSQVPLETPEQRAARQKLMGFAESGTFGQFTAGEEQNLGYGDFNATGLEQQGLSSLQGLLQAGQPLMYGTGDAALQDFLQTSPTAIDAQYAPFKDQVQRQISESERALKRQAGFAGSLYSTDTIRNLGDLQARGNETLSSEMARLIDRNLDRRLQAIPLAYQSAESQQNAALQQVDASQRYGALTRQLNDASIKARDAEILRRRQELLLPIQAAQTVAGGPPQFGVPSIETSPYQELLGLVGQVGGQYVGNELAMSQYQRRFGNPSQSRSRQAPAPSPYARSGYGA